MGVFDKFKGAGTKAKNAFSKAEAGFDSFLEKNAARAKASRAKNQKRRAQIDTILGRDEKKGKKPNVQLGPSSSPFRTEPSTPNFGTARNVIYGDPEKPKKRKRSVRIQFED